MFGIGAGELIVLLALALIIVGPQKLPEIGRNLGSALAQFKAQTDDLKSVLNFETPPAKPATSATSHFPGATTGYGSAVERLNRQAATAEQEIVPVEEVPAMVEVNDNPAKEI